MKKIMKKMVKILLILLTVLVGNFLLILVYLNGVRWVDIFAQRRHINQLYNMYQTDYTPIDESQFVDFDLETDGLRLNEAQILASHNSYKKMGSAIGKFFVGLGDSFEEARAMRYDYNPLTDQLNVGIRSFELDLRYRRGDFEVIHVPLVDNSSNTPKLALGLEEIKLWSEHNPNHFPIIVLFELKSDWMMLDPALKDFTDIELLALDTLLLETFGDTLMTPKDVLGSHATLKEAITSDGWPLIKDVLGKIIFVLHPGKYTNMYYQMDPTFSQMVMFPASSNDNVTEPYTSFLVHNDPNVASIQALISQNFIVRTRLDSNLVVNEENRVNGILSGAQILTTDFPPNHNFKTTTYVAYLKSTLTIIRNNYLLG